jgi:hypothetical protein
VIIENNQCRQSLLAGGVDGMIIRGNTIRGRLVGNGNTNLIVQDNLVRGTGKGSAVVQFGYAKGLIFRGNIIEGAEGDPIGMYVWGNSRYNDQPGENVIIANNQITATETAISLNGTKNVQIHGNTLRAQRRLLAKRTEELTTDFTEENGP